MKELDSDKENSQTRVFVNTELAVLDSSETEPEDKLISNNKLD